MARQQRSLDKPHINKYMGIYTVTFRGHKFADKCLTFALSVCVRQAVDYSHCTIKEAEIFAPWILFL